MLLRPAFHPSYRKLRIKAIRKETTDVKTLILEPEQDFPYLPGQFLTLVFDSPQGEERRSYSFSSAPCLNEPIAITLKRVPNGKYSRPLFDSSRPGDLLTSIEAAGRFTLPADISVYEQVFFFAAGVGITPIYSLIKTLLCEHPNVELVLIYSNSSQEDTVFYKELLELHGKYPRQLRLEFLISSSPNLSRARLSKWLLPQLIKDYGRGNPARQLFYTCGPFAYMRVVTISLEEQGYSQDQVRRENFDTGRPVLKLAPPDKEAHQVVITVNGEVKSFQSQFPDTILRAARNNGILLPYSCEAGKCGSCAAICTSGKVWMSYNEVLTDKEVAEGKILTCVGYPINADVLLAI